jgi:hypothetical protein
MVGLSLGDVHLERGFFVRGRVVDESGGPVAGLVVSVSGIRLLQASGRPGGAEATLEARSGPDGTFEIDGVPAANSPSSSPDPRRLSSGRLV